MGESVCGLDTAVLASAQPDLLQHGAVCCEVTPRGASVDCQVPRDLYSRSYRDSCGIPKRAEIWARGVAADHQRRVKEVELLCQSLREQIKAQALRDGKERALY